ncbi:MAG: isocitrate/isopropylmalate dehydrogenase family protein [Alphaproteobacteria bacterium]|nr:isocitrate/isopropylmalate dehydrogenase family protein [Alphaproteobacteria bacterium]
MRILLLPGDGIGPEITAATEVALRALDARFGLGLALESEQIGFKGLESYGTTLHADVVAKAEAAAGVVLGPVSSASYPPPEQGGINPSATIRKRLDLYANIRPSRTRLGVPAVVPRMDLVIVRENTEGFYADRNMALGSGEFMPTPDLALAVRRITRECSQRIGRVAGQVARRRRKRLTIVHKANVLKISDGLFREGVLEGLKDFPDVAVDELLVDAVAALLVRTPEAFDVMVATNMFGDIISNEAAELSGGLGLAPSVNASDKRVVAQASHGSAPDIAGQDRANPTALLLSAGMMLEWLADRHQRNALAEAAAAMVRAVDAQLATASGRTQDLGGPLGTRAYAAAVAARINSGL